MEHYKESTHNKKKTYSGCPKCFQSSYSCPKCEGACIFTRPFLNQLRESKSLQTQVTYKPYSEFIETLRVAILKGVSQQVDQEFSENIEEYSAVELLEIYHKNHQDYHLISNAHCNEYKNVSRAGRVNKYAVMCSHKTTIKGRCHWDKAPRSGYGGRKDNSRARRNRAIMRESADFVMEKTELDKEINRKQLDFLDM